MKNIIFISMLLTSIFALTACDGGPSGDGIVTVCTSNTIIANFNTDEAAWDVSVDANTTVVALGASGVAIFDTSRKNRPDLLIKIDDIDRIKDTEVYSLRLHDNHIYVYLKDMSDSKHYLRIFDISDVFNPLFKSEMAFDEILNNTDLIKSNWIGFEGDFIHVIGKITGKSGNYHIINVSDKTNPKITSSMTINGLCSGTNVVNEITIKDTFAYIGSYKGIDIIDFTHRDAPQWRSETLNGCSYKAFDINGNTLYTAIGYSLYAYDISDPSVAAYQGHVTSLYKKHILVCEVDKTAYTLGLNGEISILDVSTSDNMKDTDQDIFVNAKTYRIVDSEGYIYVADDAGLKIIDTCIR